MQSSKHEVAPLVPTVRISYKALYNIMLQIYDSRIIEVEANRNFTSVPTGSHERVDSYLNTLYYWNNIYE